MYGISDILPHILTTTSITIQFYNGHFIRSDCRQFYVTTHQGFLDQLINIRGVFFFPCTRYPFPATYVGLMLARRRRRRANINPT